MADWALRSGGKKDTVGEVASSSSMTVITASATANTKGSYTQIVASTAFDSTWMMLIVRGFGTSRGFLLDLAIGAAASEKVIISNLLLGSSGNGCLPGTYGPFPISIPAGTRIAARLQSTTGSSTAQIEVVLGASGFADDAPLGIVTTYGADTSDSGGTQVDPGGTINTKGTWSEITSSTSREIKALCIAIGNQSNSAPGNASWLFDIGIGAGGSEKVVLADLYLVTTSSFAAQLIPNAFAFPISIPSGTRLSARAQCVINDATDRLFDVALYGVS